MTNFEKWDKALKSQNLFLFNNNPNGLLWLKVRAICRGKQLSEFLETNNIFLASKKISDKNRELFEILEQREDAAGILDNFLRCVNHDWYVAKGVDVAKLKEDLYRVKNYNWGGDQNNSLDKYYVSHYIKTISNYDVLQSKQREIADNAWNYVQNSWYNNWTSFLIESIFKQNPRVISAIGEIKSVDFFIGEYPMDLKVTFFPNQYMDDKIRCLLGKKVLPWLKSQCVGLGITTDSKLSESQQLYTLKEKLLEQNKHEIIEMLNATRRAVVESARQDPGDLIKWLYEHQGELRFGAENRLYLILSDPDDFENSWKLKRAFSLIEPIVKEYLKSFNHTKLKDISFEFKGQTYKCLSDAIFITK